MAQAVLTWTPGGGPTSTSQKVQYRLKGTLTWTTFSTVGPTVGTETITGLTDNEIYEFRTVNVCSVGGEQPSGMDEKVKVTCTAAPTLTPSYDSIDVEFANLGHDVTSYVIHLLDASNAPVGAPVTKNSPFSDPVTHTFTGLTEETTYKIKIDVYVGAVGKTDCTIYSTATTEIPTCTAPTLTDVTIS